MQLYRILTGIYGLDIYNSSEDYIGHATGNPASLEAGIQIPLFVYMSKKYINNHYKEYERISLRSDSIFNMRIFTQLLMDDVGICWQSQ